MTVILYERARRQLISGTARLQLYSVDEQDGSYNFWHSKMTVTLSERARCQLISGTAR
jgi:hypothetical protein